MTPSEIVYKLLGKAKLTQAQLAVKMGYTSQGTVSNRLKRGSMNMSTFIAFMDGFGYEVIVRPAGQTLQKDEIRVTSKDGGVG